MTPYPLPEALKLQYWPVWIGVGLLKLISMLPFRAQTWVGRQLGNLMYLLMHKRRCISMANLKLVFPKLEKEQRVVLLKKNFQHLGLMLTDSGFGWWASQKRLKKHIKITGREYLDQALAAGKGVILLTPHTTSLDIGGVVVCLDYPMHVMYKRSSNKLAEAVIRRGRERFCKSMFTHERTRNMFAVLKAGEVLWYSPDQDFGPKRSIFSEFMGVQTATTPATARLAQKTGATVIPFQSFRLPGNHGLEIKFLPPLKNFPTDDMYKNTRAINRSFEDFIHQHPEQYLWLHRRFKTRPDGEPPVYDC